MLGSWIGWLFSLRARAEKRVRETSPKTSNLPFFLHLSLSGYYINGDVAVHAARDRLPQSLDPSFDDLGRRHAAWERHGLELMKLPDNEADSFEVRI